MYTHAVLAGLTLGCPQVHLHCGVSSGVQNFPSVNLSDRHPDWQRESNRWVFEMFAIALPPHEYQSLLGFTHFKWRMRSCQFRREGPTGGLQKPAGGRFVVLVWGLLEQNVTLHQDQRWKKSRTNLIYSITSESPEFKMVLKQSFNIKPVLYTKKCYFITEYVLYQWATSHVFMLKTGL